MLQKLIFCEVSLLDLVFKKTKNVTIVEKINL